MPARRRRDLRMLGQQVFEARDGHGGVARPPGAAVFPDIGERAAHRPDPADPGHPENPVVVLGVAVRDLLVVQARLGEHVPAHGQRRGMQFLDPVAQQQPLADPLGAGGPGDDPAVGQHEPDARAHHEQVRLVEQPPDLGLELGRVPHVVVVAGGDEAPAWPRRGRSCAHRPDRACGDWRSPGPDAPRCPGWPGPGRVAPGRGPPGTRSGRGRSGRRSRRSSRGPGPAGPGWAGSPTPGASAPGRCSLVHPGRTGLCPVRRPCVAPAGDVDAAGTRSPGRPRRAPPGSAPGP